ncbi:MAG TPA: hemolysin family protein [Myxococcales bacterium]|nr:hemolysin family protein [Myxococcales bacterium]
MLELVAAGAALIGRALLQGEDAAVLAVSEQDLRDAATEPHLATSARRVLELKSDPEATAAALRAAGSALLAFAAVACAIWVNGVLTRAGIARASMSSASLQLLAGIFAGVVALVLDLAPRSLAAARPLRWSLALSSPAWFLCKTLKWPLQLLLRVFDTLLLGSGATARYTPPPPPLEQIERILTGEGRAGEKAPPPELVHGLFEFAEKTAKEVMVPRTNVVGVPVGSTVDDVLALLAEEGHTRMPVFEDDLDHIKGVLHTKDVIPLLANPELIVLQDLIRPAVWVPWTKRVDEILREMQQKRSHIVMVADEYGGLSGIVTLEDVLELVVGELGEERRPVELPVPPLGPDGTTLVRAETRIEEVNDALGAELPRDGGFETLAGLLNSCAGAIPQTGDRFYVGGLELTVLQRDDRRVRLVRISRATATQPPPAS